MTELTSTQIKILKFINTNKSINCESVSNKFNMHTYDVVQNIQILNKNDLIRIDSNGYFHSLPFGKSYFEMRTRNTIKTILTSIVCPVIVSFITTLITLWLSN